MTRIGTPGAPGTNATTEPRAEETRRHLRDREAGTRFSEGGLDDRSGGLSRQDGRFDPHGTGAEADRQGRFLERVREALSQGTADTDDAAGGGDARLLAEAGRSASLPSPLSLHAGLPSPVADAAPLPAGSVERVETLVARIETVARAEMAARGGAGLSLKLDLGAGEGLPGVGSLTITMTATTVDVVLARTGADLPSDLAVAAQALADRLQQRFSKRVVRVLETAAAEPSSSNGMDGIARLLDRRETPS